MSDSDLIRRIQSGDETAFRELYDQYAPLVLKYVQMRVSNRQDAEELTATVFVKAWKALPRYKDQGAPITAWLFRIAYNTVVDKYRKKRLSLTSLMPWTKATPDNRFSQIDQQSVIRQLFDTLSYEQQVILYLNFFEGYNLKEIAGFLGKTPNSVRVIKHRTLKQLNKELSGVAN